VKGVVTGEVRVHLDPCDKCFVSRRRELPLRRCTRVAGKRACHFLLTVALVWCAGLGAGNRERIAARDHLREHLVHVEVDSGEHLIVGEVDRLGLGETVGVGMRNSDIHSATAESAGGRHRRYREIEGLVAAAHCVSMAVPLRLRRAPQYRSGGARALRCPTAESAGGRHRRYREIEGLLAAAHCASIALPLRLRQLRRAPQCRSGGARALRRAARGRSTAAARLSTLSARRGQRRHTLALAMDAEAHRQILYVVAVRPVRHRFLVPCAQVPHVAHGLHRDVVLPGEGVCCAVARRARAPGQEDGDRRVRIQLSCSPFMFGSDGVQRHRSCRQLCGGRELMMMIRGLQFPGTEPGSVFTPKGTIFKSVPPI